jgi:rod shape-determining protein MreC
VRLSADYERLEFLRVLRNPGVESITETGGMLVPSSRLQGPPIAAQAQTNEVKSD